MNESNNMETKIFHLLVETAAQGVLIMDLGGDIRYANPCACRLMGVNAPEHPIGKSVFLLHAPASRGRMKNEIFPTVLRNGQWTGELEIQGADGHVTHTIDSFFIIPDETGKALFVADMITDVTLLVEAQGVLAGESAREQESPADDRDGRTAKLTDTNEKLRREITRRRQVESMLRESENRYRAVVENQSELICRFLPDYTVTFVNDALCTYFSKERKQLMGESFLPLVYEGDREKIAAFYRSFTDRKIHDTNEHRVIVKDGEVRWQQWNARAVFDDRGTIVEFQTVGRDITDRLKAEVALRDSEERYRIVTKHAADAILVIQKNRLVFVNDAFATMCGYGKASRLIGREVTEIIAANFREKFIRYMETLHAGVKRETLFRKRILRRDGREVWTEGLYTLIQWEGAPAVLCTSRDITVTKQREMKNRREAKVLRQQNIKLAATIKDRFRFGNIVGKSQAMQDVYEQILAASATPANVVVYGESGTGKELVATAIHELSDRSDAAFVPVNCGAIPERLMESEFFGHKKGAFTGADTDKDGYLDVADRGTLFLDEVGDISVGVQVKLLRAIEGGGHTPLGSNQVRRSDFRIIAATHRPLMELVETGSMREDFFFRIHIVPIYLPPLRERKEDIILLTDHFMEILSHDKEPGVLPGNILDAFVEYDWPGNVRELQNVLQRYLTMGRLEFASGWQAKPSAISEVITPEEIGGDDFRSKVDGFEKRLILKSLEKCHWNRTRVCAELKIPRRTLFNKMKRHGLDLH